MVVILFLVFQFVLFRCDRQCAYVLDFKWECFLSVWFRSEWILWFLLCDHAYLSAFLRSVLGFEMFSFAQRVLIKLWQKMIIRTEVIKSGKQKYASSSCELLVEIHNLTSLLIVLTHCSHSLLTRTMYIRCLVSLSVKWAQACALGSRNFSSLFTKQQQTF